MKRYYKAFAIILLGLLAVMPLFQGQQLTAALNKPQNNPNQTTTTNRAPAPTPQKEWSYSTGDMVYSSPCVADVDGDGQLEVLVGSWDHKVYCLSGTGAYKWSYKTGGIVDSSPCVADMDGDGELEILVASTDGKVYCLNGTGALVWTYQTGGLSISSPCVADLRGDGQLKVLIGSLDCNVYCLNEAGDLNWTFSAVSSFESSPCVADVDGDGHLEVLVGSVERDGNLYCLSGTGGKEWNYTTKRGIVWSSPCVADVDGDNQLEVLVGSVEGKLYCFGGTGGLEWSYQAGDVISSSPCVADVDGDGQLEVLVGDMVNCLHCLSVVGAPFNVAAFCWPSIGFRGDVQRTGCYIDSDGDGLTDGYEITAGTDLDKSDTDGNGVTDYIEFTHSNNPFAKKPDFAVFRWNIAFQKAEGITDVSATVKNLGLACFKEIKVRFADVYGNDSSQIGTDQVINGLRYKESKTVSVKWNATLFHIVYVYVDPEDEIAELNEANNVAFKGTGNNTPVITSVTSDYGSWLGNTVGTFLDGLNIFKAQIKNRFYVHVDDLDGDAHSVVFRLSGNEYVAAMLRPPDDTCWYYDFDMCNISWSISAPGYREADVQVVVTDESGMKSSAAFTIWGVGLPSWINDFVATSESRWECAEKFVHVDWDSRSQTINLTLTLPAEDEPAIDKHRQVPDQVPGGEEEKSDQGLKFWLTIRLSYCVKTQQAFVSGEGQLQFATAKRGFAAKISIDAYLKPGTMELDNATIKFTLILPLYYGPSIGTEEIEKYLPSYVTDHLELDIGCAVGILVGVETLIKAVYDGAQVVLQTVTWLIDVGVWAQGWINAKLDLGFLNFELLLSATSCIHFIIQRLQDATLKIAFEGRPGFKLYFSLKVTMGWFRFTTEASVEWNFIISSPEEVNVTPVITPWSCVQDYSAFVDSRPRVAADRQGNAMMVWCSNTLVNNRTYTDICYSIWDGAGWGGANFLTSDEYIDFDPALTYDSNGNVIVVWSRITVDPSTITPDNPMGMFENQEIFYSIWDRTTGAWSTPQPITSDQCADGNAVVSADINGAAMAVWVKDFDHNFTTAGDTDLYYSIWNGTHWSPEASLTNNTWIDYSVSLAYDSNGNAMACWISDLDSNMSTTQDRELRYATWNGTEQSWSPSDLVTYSDEKKNSPSIVFDKYDNALVTWVGGNETVNRIYFASRDNTTGSWSQPEIVHEDTSFIDYPAVNVDPDNTAVIVWRGFEDDSKELEDYFSSLDKFRNYTAGEFSDRDAYISQLNAQNMTKIYFDGEICYATKELSTPGAVWSNVRYLTSDNKTDWMVSAVIIRGHSNDLLLVWEKEGSLSNLTHALEPDLAIGNSDIMFSNKQPRDGETIDVTARIANIGDVGAHDVLVEFYDGDPRSGGILIGSYVITHLAYDGIVNVTIQFSFGPGTHDIYVVIDPHGSVTELDETNNIAYNSFSILPDLSVDSIDITFSNTDPFAGEQILINARIHNQGGASAEDVVVGFFSNSDLIGDATILLLNAGECETVSMPWTAAAGYNNITVIIDPINAIAEWNEENNNATSLISILPDLSLNRIDLSSNDLLVGQSVKISTEIVNLGAAAANSVLVELFDGNPFVGGSVIYSETLDIPTGANSSFLFTWTPPPGIHQIFVVVDRENLIPERNETNNVRYQELVVRSLPDLSVSESDITYESGPLKIIVPVKNIGESVAAGVLIGLYDGDPATGGKMINSDIVFSISPGEVSTVKLVLYKPPTSGYLYIIVDPQNTIVESNEENNRVMLDYAAIPKVDAGPDQVVDEGATVQFSGSALVPGNIEDYTFTWDFGDGDMGVGTSPTHEYGDNGTYTATLTVSGAKLVGTDQMKVTVRNVAPTAEAGPDLTVSEDTVVYLNGSFSDPGWLDTHTFLWDFGDGTTGTNRSVSHVYPDPGTYVAIFTATDDDGGIGIDKCIIEVLDRTPPLTTIALDGTLGLKGWYLSDVIVSLTSIDATSGVASTAYSFDGSNWLNYTGPFTVSAEGATTVYYCSTDSAGNAEVAKTETIMIDKTAPITTETHSGTMGLRGWYVSNVSVTLCATDGISGLEQTLYCLDGLTWHLYADPFIITSEGTTAVQYRSIDNAGNEEPIKTQTFMIDKTPPVTSIILNGTPGLQGWFLSDIIVSLLATDDTSGVAKIMYSFDGETWYTYYCVASSTMLTVNTQIESFSAYTPITLYGVLLDETGGGVVGETINIYVRANLTGWTDWTYLTSCTTYPTGEWYTDSISGNSIARLPIGSHLVAQFRAEFAGTAAYGASSAETHNITIWYVEEPPEGPIIILDSLDSTSARTVFDPPGPFTITAEGVTTVYYYSVDIAGNLGDQETATIKIDKTAPETTESHSGALGSEGWYISDVVIAFEATDHVPGSDAVVIEYSFDQNDWKVCTGSIAIITEGTTTIHYRAVDLAGNMEAEKSATISIDKTKPVTSASLSGTQGLNNWFVSDVNVCLTATDGFSGVKYTEYSYDEVGWTTYTSPFTINKEGATTVIYRSIDEAGNVEDVKTVEVRIDKTDPVTTIVLEGIIGNNNWYISDVTFHLDASDPSPGSGIAKIEYSFDGSNWLNYTGPFTVSTEGVTAVYYCSTDNAGNVEARGSTIIMIDETPPTTCVTIGTHYVDEAGNIYVTSATQLTFIATDSTSGVANTYYSINGNKYNNYVGAFNLSGSDGSYSISYYSVDAAGNVEVAKSMVVNLSSIKVNSFVTGDWFCRLRDFHIRRCCLCINSITHFDVVLVPWYSYSCFHGTRFDGIQWCHCDYSGIANLEASGQRHVVYKLVATIPHEFLYVVNVTNDWPIGVGNLTINAIVPSDFKLDGWCPVRVFLDFRDVSRRCLISGTTVTVNNVPSGSSVYVVISLEYGLVGDFYSSHAEYGMKGYTFSADVSAVGGSPSVAGGGLIGAYGCSTNLFSHQAWTTAIAGFVMKSDGKTIRGATVELLDSNGNTICGTSTDENGLYFFMNIRPGDYTVRLTYEGQTHVSLTSAMRHQVTQVDFRID